MGQHGGRIDKFIGAAVMAVFGSPLSRGAREEARQAVRGLAELDNGVTEVLK